MIIIANILEALGFKENKRFSVDIAEIQMRIEVTPFISEKSQVYLVADCLNSDLQRIAKNDSCYMSAIRTCFRLQDYHNGEMDKNTFLLLNCLCGDNQYPDYDSRIRLEDTPYYFKRHILFYKKENEETTLRWLKKVSTKEQIVDSVSNYLSNSANFEQYKKKGDSIYEYMAEVNAKITSLPIYIPQNDDFKSVDEYLKGNLETKQTAKRTRSVIIVDETAINSLLLVDLEKETIESIISKWNSIKESNKGVHL